MARGISFAFPFIVGAAACVGDDPDTSGTTPGTTPAVDGGTTDGGGATGTNLVENGSFENGCGEPLFFSNGQMTSDATAKTGGKSCKVCRTAGGEPSLYFHARVDVKPKAGEVYEVSAWMRKAPGIDSGGNSQLAFGGVDSGGTFNEDGASANGPVAVTDEWKPASVTWTVAKDGADGARVDLGLPQAADGVCFLVDDLVITKK